MYIFTCVYECFQKWRIQNLWSHACCISANHTPNHAPESYPRIIPRIIPIYTVGSAKHTPKHTPETYLRNIPRIIPPDATRFAGHGVFGKGHVQYFHIFLCIPFLLFWGIKVPITYATDLSGWISSILFSKLHLHHLWIIFYLLIWDLFFIKDFERNDIILHHRESWKACAWSPAWVWIYRKISQVTSVLVS